MLSSAMREILLYSLSSEHDFDPEEYSKNSINALLRKKYIEGEDDYYEITKKGVRALGLPTTIKAKRPQTIIKKVLKALCSEDVELLKSKDLPSIAGDEDHNTDRTHWYSFSDVICAFEYMGDEQEYICAQIACDYAEAAGFDLYIETVRHYLLFYLDEDE